MNLIYFNRLNHNIKNFIQSIIVFSFIVTFLYLFKEFLSSRYLIGIIYIITTIFLVNISGYFLEKIKIPILNRKVHNIWYVTIFILCIYIIINSLFLKLLLWGIFNQLIFWIAYGFNNILFFIILKNELIKSGVKPKKDVDAENTRKKLLSIDKNLQNIIDLEIYQKELLIQNLQKRLNGIRFKLWGKLRSFSGYMCDFNNETQVPARLIMEVLYIFDTFEPNLKRETLFCHIAISQKKFDSGEIYKNKYYVIQVHKKQESKNKKIRNYDFFEFDDSSSIDKKEHNKRRQSAGLYYAYSLQNLIDTLFADIRSGKI